MLASYQIPFCRAYFVFTNFDENHESALRFHLQMDGRKWLMYYYYSCCTSLCVICCGSGSGSTSDVAPYRFVSHVPPASLTRDSSNVSVFDYDPRNPCPSIGGNVFGYRDVLLAGAFDQVERAGHFLCKPPYLPLSSRRDVVVFRTPPLREALDVTGMVVVKLVISSSAVDTDFTAKLVDEYPASADYPAGYAMQVTHGIRRCRFRDSRTKASLMEPGKAYEVTVELYPTSNLFAVGHRLRLDVSSSNFPHFDLNMNTGEEFESQRCVVAQNRSVTP